MSRVAAAMTRIVAPGVVMAQLGLRQRGSPHGKSPRRHRFARHLSRKSQRQLWRKPQQTRTMAAAGAPRLLARRRVRRTGMLGQLLLSPRKPVVAGSQLAAPAEVVVAASPAPRRVLAVVGVPTLQHGAK